MSPQNKNGLLVYSDMLAVTIISSINEMFGKNRKNSIAVPGIPKERVWTFIFCVSSLFSYCCPQ
jgi:hypothetical protein